MYFSFTFDNYLNLSCCDVCVHEEPMLRIIPHPELEAGPLGQQSRNYLFAFFTHRGCIIFCDAICLRPAEPPVWQDGVEMNDGIWDVASFASLTNWGKSWRDESRRRERAGMEAGQGMNTYGIFFGSWLARGHNLQHLLAVTDQRRSREVNGLCYRV